LAKLDSEFDWRGEAWETLTHELRHHLEWRARAPDLEEFDWAAEQNFARQDGERFDPTFYRSGEKVAEGIYRLDDDFFLERRPWLRGPNCASTGTADHTAPHFLPRQHFRLSSPWKGLRSLLRATSSSCFPPRRGCVHSSDPRGS
jgi:hypothetical protein